MSASSSPQKSTPASSPPPEAPEMASHNLSEAMMKEEEQMRVAREKEDAKRDTKLQKEVQKDLKGGEKAVDGKFKALEYLLNQSQLYSTIMLAQMQQQEDDEVAQDEKGRKRAQKKEEKAEAIATAQQRRSTRGAPGEEKQENTAEDDARETLKSLPTRGRGRPPKKEKSTGKIKDYFKKEDIEAKAGKGDVKTALQEAAESDVKTSDVGMQDLKSARQPALVKGGTMRKYQLEGLDWLISLYENGLNGILADEMGLGKTIQTISFLAFLREKHSYGPFLIAAPLSTTSNWVEEFGKWTPDIPVVLYHGSKQEREEIRSKRLKSPGSEKFPVVVTSYEICMNDRKHLASFGWKFIIIDEGHRIKNLNCRLIRELQSYQSANRLLITGTPLQNNLTELWSLLHFLMPSIFDKLEAFESWFDFSALKERNGYHELLSEKRQQQLVSSLHAILKPFLLRRVKADVENMMPRKREYVLFAPLSTMQRELYQAILDGTTRSYLEGKAVESIAGSGTSTPRSTTSTASRKRKAIGDADTNTPSKSAKSSREATPATGSVRGRRKGVRQSYEEISDRQYFASLEKEGSQPPSDPETEASQDEEELIRAENLQLAKRQIASKKLQNPVMQLRLCCNSPFNFFNPFLANVADDGDIVPDETLVTSSGKMHLLDQLLPELFKEGHKVLIFSQFKTQLDLLELYATGLRKWPVCRIDGSIPQSERHAQIKSFNQPADQKTKSADVRNLFLLSTRAGGQGINLAAADTVILFDSDWNPQQDLQAQDRAHRIGQTRNVIVYRFATRNTVEQQLLESANSKRRLEKLVIRKGGLTGGNAKSRVEREQKEEIDELQRLLRREDGERWDVDRKGGDKGILSRKDLDILLDRGEDAYDRAEKGLDVEGDAFRTVESKGEGALLEGLKA